jgi:hypothetical protein
MEKIRTYLDIPQKSIINKSFGKTDYSDTYSISIHNSQNYSIDYLTGIFFTSIPIWIKNLLSFRNFLVRFFGLRGGNIDKLKKPYKSVHYTIGSEALIFKVFDRNENEIVMADNDKHLNFRTSVMIERISDTDIINLYSSTIVYYNNIWGRLYFLPVKPFHKLIIRTMLKIISKRITE